MNIFKGLLINLLAYLGIGTFSSQPVEFIPIIYWLALLILGRFGVGLVYFPSKFYQDTRREANKRSWQDIEIKPYNFPEHSGFGVGLQFVSDKPVEYDVSFVTIEITNIVQNMKEITGRMYVDLLHGENSAFRKQDVIIHRKYLKGNYVVVAPIAKWNNDRAWIDVNEENGRREINIEKDIICNLHIVLSGKLNAGISQMDLCPFSCNLLYHQNKNGQMIVSIDPVNREPEYKL